MLEPQIPILHVANVMRLPRPHSGALNADICKLIFSVSTRRDRKTERSKDALR